MPEIYRRQPVFYRTSEAPGTIIIDTSERFLYLIQPNNVALRYGIGVGRDGFQWNGLLKITRKAEWPDWTPPPEMIERQPYLPRFMAGGPGNPMGARALYLGSTVYRIHGTNAPETIGHAVSSGCFRLVNERDHGSLRPRAGRHQGDRAAVRPSRVAWPTATRTAGSVAPTAPCRRSAVASNAWMATNSSDEMTASTTIAVITRFI